MADAPHPLAQAQMPHRMKKPFTQPDSTHAPPSENAAQNTCPLCGRELIAGPSVNEHHLVPRTYRGQATVRMHRVCHNKIHLVFSERELAQYYHTVERLMESEEIRNFVRWVQRKHPAWYDSHDKGRNRSRR